MEDLVKIITVVICFLPTMLSVWSIYRVGIKILTCIQVFFYIVFVLPLLLDFFFGVPSYYRYPGFIESNKKFDVLLVYCFFLIFVSYFNWFMRGLESIDFGANKNNKFFTYILFLFALLPILFFLFLPDYTPYFIYGGDHIRPFSIESAELHSYMSFLTFFSVICCCYLMVRVINKNIVLFILLFFICIFDFWINGKRAIVFIFSFFLGFLFLLKFKGLNSMLFLIFLTLITLFYSNWYQSTTRHIDNSVAFEEKYENIRIDFFRDQRVQMAIYSKLYPQEMEILSYPGQSFLFLLTFYVPRDYWEEKPYPYAQYFTSAIYFSEPKFWGWGMTTSIYDEFIANFGLSGIFLFQYMVLYHTRKTMKIKSSSFQFVTIFVILLSFMVHLIAFIGVYIFYFAWYSKIRFRSGN